MSYLTINWLTQGQAEQMLALPDRATNKGKRDRALLCLLLGCGLRREELAGLAVEHIVPRDGRWVIADLEGRVSASARCLCPRGPKPLLINGSPPRGSQTAACCGA